MGGERARSGVAHKFGQARAGNKATKSWAKPKLTAQTGLPHSDCGCNSATAMGNALPLSHSLTHTLLARHKSFSYLCCSPRPVPPHHAPPRLAAGNEPLGNMATLTTSIWQQAVGRQSGSGRGFQLPPCRCHKACDLSQISRQSFNIVNAD